MLGEQRAALQALRGRVPRRRGAVPAGDRPFTAGDGSRLLALAIEVLAQAALATEAECRRIVEAAEAHAATIVQAAHDDVDRLAGWLDADWRAVGPAPAAGAAAGAGAGGGPVATGQIDLGHGEGPGGTGEPDLGSGRGLDNRFFDSAPLAPEGDPWSFMNDDDLVGTGPALLRRVLRRPPGPRPHSVD